MDRGDLANLSAFVTVADQRSFRAAASRLDVTPVGASAIRWRQLEARLGVRLLNRTTRSVSVTDAGPGVCSNSCGRRSGQISDALEDLNRERSRPFRTSANLCDQYWLERGVIAPVWQRFPIDLPGGSPRAPAWRSGRSILWRRDSDAGCRTPRNRAAADMVAVRVTGPLKVSRGRRARPTFARRPRPGAFPDDLRPSQAASNIGGGVDGRGVSSGRLSGNGKSQKDFGRRRGDGQQSRFGRARRRLMGWGSRT